jgi:hypothetical protein
MVAFVISRTISRTSWVRTWRAPTGSTIRSIGADSSALSKCRFCRHIAHPWDEMYNRYYYIYSGYQSPESLEFNHQIRRSRSLMQNSILNDRMNTSQKLVSIAHTIPPQIESHIADTPFAIRQRSTKDQRSPFMHSRSCAWAWQLG